MPVFHYVYAHSGIVLLIAVAGVNLPGLRKVALPWRLGVVVMVVALSLIPVDGLMLAGYLRGVVGDPSIITVAFLLNVLVFRLAGREFLSRQDRTLMLSVIAATGLIFYPLALGLSPFDPYGLGYQPVLLGTLLLVLTLAAIFTGRPAVVVIICIAVAAFNLQLLESANLWDYLVDPLITMYAWVWMGTRVGISLRRDGAKARAGQ